MATVQLVGVRDGIATIQKDSEPAVEVTWTVLHLAQQQEDNLGRVYRWLMREFCRCEHLQRQGIGWQSPRRDVAAIAQEMRQEEEQAQRAANRAALARLERESREQAERERREEILRVAAERQQTDADDPWYPIPAWEVPGNVRFDTLRHDQGQIVERSYGTFGRAEAGSCDPYMRLIDHSDSSIAFYRRRETDKE